MNEHRDDELREILGVLREDFRAPPELRADVMAEIRAIPEPLWKRAVDWLLRPRTIEISPAVGGLAVAGVALIIAVWPGREGPAVPGIGTELEQPFTPAAANEAAEPTTTRFVFVASDVSSVRVTGDFLDWDPEGIPLEDLRGTGIWTVDVPLSPGVHQYTFILDGTRWTPDPRAVSQVDDGFGQTNSVVIVPGNGAV